MKLQILLFLLIVICLLVFTYSSIETFLNTWTSMIEFARLDGSLIKKIKIGSSTSLYDSEVINLFRQDEVIRINIPENYTVRIIYKFKNESKGFGKTINLNSGSYDITKTDGNKQIYQIDVSQNFGLSTNYSDYLNYPNYLDYNSLIIRDFDGNVLYTGSRLVPIDWDLIYTTFGYDDYYVYYPSSNFVRTYYYSNYPRYKLYRPSDRILKYSHYPLYKSHDPFYRYRNELNYHGTHGVISSPTNRIKHSNLTNPSNKPNPKIIQGKAQLLNSNLEPLIRGKGQWILPNMKTTHNPKSKPSN